MNIAKDNQGISALLTIVIIGAAGLLMAYSSVVMGLGELEMGYDAQQGKQAFSVADSCVEEAYYRLKLDSGYTGGTLNFDSGSCIIAITGSGSNRTINIEASLGDYTQKIESEVTISGSEIVIDSWEEISS
jgi:hypothetical protein